MTDDIAFDEKRARTYRPLDRPKRARIVEVPPGERTTIVAPWGEEEHFVGTWVAVLDDAGEVDYGVGYAEWIDMHERIPGHDDLWIKVAPVDAYRYEGPPGRVTTILRDGTVETTNTVHDGDWLVRHSGGELTVVTDAEFQARYEVAGA